MNMNNWKIWNKDESVEQRTFDRTLNILPEMESAKQLSLLIKEVYQDGMSILDVGCAAGHYYNSLKKIDKNLIYKGIDATVKYINFAKNHFKSNNNVSFDLIDIYKMQENLKNQFEIVFCCNVILHLPTFKDPLINLIKSSKKYIFIRTLISEKTHLSKYLYNDELDLNEQPINFCYQNTYSRESLINFINKEKNNLGKVKIDFIKDEYIAENIDNEYKNYNSKQNAVTNISNNLQIAGSKVFEWEWMKITKL